MTRKNLQRYYTLKRLIKHIYISIFGGYSRVSPRKKFNKYRNRIFIVSSNCYIFEIRLLHLKQSFLQVPQVPQVPRFRGLQFCRVVLPENNERISPCTRIIRNLFIARTGLFVFVPTTAWSPPKRNINVHTVLNSQSGVDDNTI